VSFFGRDTKPNEHSLQGRSKRRRKKQYSYDERCIISSTSTLFWASLDGSASSGIPGKWGERDKTESTFSASVSFSRKATAGVSLHCGDVWLFPSSCFKNCSRRYGVQSDEQETRDKKKTRTRIKSPVNSASGLGRRPLGLSLAKICCKGVCFLLLFIFLHARTLQCGFSIWCTHRKVTIWMGQKGGRGQQPARPARWPGRILERCGQEVAVRDQSSGPKSQNARGKKKAKRKDFS
jgi:hypothetical protein